MIENIRIGDRLVHRSNPLLSGFVRGVDSVGPQSRPGRCVWLDCPTRKGKPWLRIGEKELEEYRITDET
jgi:hypothetical protein